MKKTSKQRKDNSLTTKPRRAKPKTTANSKPTAAGSVRIIGGQFKRRSMTFIDADGLRPTPDRLRETLFNWLLADIYSARVLDSCAGSGVLGFEALSRGAAHCTFIEASHPQSQMIQQSAQLLSLATDNYQIFHGMAEKVLTQAGHFQHPFDIVFIDPPYAEDLWKPILTTLILQDLISANTLIYLEADKDLDDQLAELATSLQIKLTTQGASGFECVKQTKVGQVVAGLYRLAPS